MSRRVTRAIGDFMGTVVGIGEALGPLIAVSLSFAALAAWATSVIICIKESSWLLLLFGCVFFPVGVVHGVGVWFGLF